MTETAAKQVQPNLAPTSTVESTTRLHLKVNNRVEILEFSNDCTDEEVQHLFLAAAEVADDAQPVVLRLKGSDGALLPIGPGLAGNASADPNEVYTLDIWSGMLHSGILDEGSWESPTDLSRVYLSNTRKSNQLGRNTIHFG
jgi:hypothetical protein